MYSNVVVCGRLVNDLVLRTNQQSEQKFCLFTVAVNEYNYYSKTRMTHYINCIISGRNAENMARFLKKGALILVEGALKSRLITGENASKINSLMVRANNVVFLESKKTSTRSQQAVEPHDETLTANDEAASSPSQSNSTSSQQNNQASEGEIDWE